MNYIKNTSPILDATDEIDALRRLPVAKVVISRGTVVATTEPVRTKVKLNDKSEEIAYRK